MTTGTITRIYFDRGFGFIRRDVGGPDLYFHRSHLAGGLSFNEQLNGRRVEFTEEGSPKGSRAMLVRPCD